MLAVATQTSALCYFCILLWLYQSVLTLHHIKFAIIWMSIVEIMTQKLAGATVVIVSDVYSDIWKTTWIFLLGIKISLFCGEFSTNRSSMKKDHLYPFTFIDVTKKNYKQHPFHYSIHSYIFN